MTAGGQARIGRRTLLAGAGAFTMLTASGCKVSFTSTKVTRTVVATAPPPTDPMVNLIATARLHLLRITAVIPNVPAAQKATLTGLRNDRQAHLDALEREYARTSGATGTATESPTTGAVTVPSDPATAIALLREDIDRAQVQFTDAIAIVSRYRAALLASISACLATHRVVLS